MNENKSGPAFPQCSYNMRGGYDITGGMTLRDYFAAKAMQGLIERGFTEFGNAASQYANLAYEYADAMLEARK